VNLSRSLDMASLPFLSLPDGTIFPLWQPRIQRSQLRAPGDRTENLANRRAGRNRWRRVWRESDHP
jgi:hypothetical protein